MRNSVLLTAIDDERPQSGLSIATPGGRYPFSFNTFQTALKALAILNSELGIPKGKCCDKPVKFTHTLTRMTPMRGPQT